MHNIGSTYQIKANLGQNGLIKPFFLWSSYNKGVWTFVFQSCSLASRAPPVHQGKLAFLKTKSPTAVLYVEVNRSKSNQAGNWLELSRLREKLRGAN